MSNIISDGETEATVENVLDRAGASTSNAGGEAIDAYEADAESVRVRSGA